MHGRRIFSTIKLREYGAAGEKEGGHMSGRIQFITWLSVSSCYGHLPNLRHDNYRIAASQRTVHTVVGEKY